MSKHITKSRETRVIAIRAPLAQFFALVDRANAAGVTFSEYSRMVFEDHLQRPGLRKEISTSQAA